MPGAAAINEGRKARGFKPLTIVTVPVIGKGRGSAIKLSSTDLRAADAADAAAAAAAAGAVAVAVSPAGQRH